MSDTKKVRDGLLEDLRKLKERLDVKETEFDDIAAFNSFEQPTDPLGKADLQDCWFRGAKWQHAQIMNKLRGSSDTKTSDLDVDQTSAKVNIEKNDSALDQTKPDTERPRRIMWATPNRYGQTKRQLMEIISSLGFEGKIEIMPCVEMQELTDENTSLRDEIAIARDYFDRLGLYDAKACREWTERMDEIRDKRNRCEK